jgi:uncharacterized protein
MRALAIGFVLGMAATAVQAAILPVQPAAERARQAMMPVSSDPVWALLRKTPIQADLAKGVFTAAPPPEVKALAGREMDVTGFMLPLDPSPMFSHFLLTRNTPVCAFCPPGAPNEVIEVNLSQYVRATSEPITVHGRFVLQDNGGQGLFFQLNQAELR